MEKLRTSEDVRQAIYINIQPLTNGQAREITDTILPNWNERKHNKIGTIREIRNLVGIGLKEAKDLFEIIYERYEPEAKDQAQEEIDNLKAQILELRLQVSRLSGERDTYKHLVEYVLANK
jgi:ribosomal protein L7/L12